MSDNKTVELLIMNLHGCRLSLLCISLFLLALPSCRKKGEMHEANQSESLRNDAVRAMVLKYWRDERKQYKTPPPGPEFMAALEERDMDIIEHSRVELIGADYRALITCDTKMHPAAPQVWMIDKSGIVSPIDLDVLVSAFKSFPRANTEAQKAELIRNFLSILSWDSGLNARCGRVIESVDDIPGYGRSSLDADIEVSVKPPYVVGDAIYVLHTYQRIGGIVSRYEFHFSPEGFIESADLTKLASRVGDYRILQ